MIKSFECDNKPSNDYDTEAYHFLIGSSIYDIYTKNGKRIIPYRILRALDEDYYINFINFLTANDNDELNFNFNSKVKQIIKRTIKVYNKRFNKSLKVAERYGIVF